MTCGTSPHAQGNLLQCRNKETLQENDDQDEDHGAEVDTAQGREESSDPGKEWICYLHQETDNRIIRVSIDPGDDSPGDDNPDIGAEDYIEKLCQRQQKITEHKHDFASVKS